ncbi:peptidoglycan D,D-transpeptidase FtsI family protein [Planosporangium mesophilum]|uniref:Penicillin-binding protein A n=1 Tax=Planosporangium mesophilum TaxID=689768 RepID=A0A8J3T9H8_9ACTN|nr:penicillin-binding protein 2 [Planosporangium mesophilum]NJC82160.1 penicillin-binding protein 2 [Planosporangium mesophilum]GII22209.1 penicillin-binding protein A [Planosporangium mesophilum]
MNAPLRRVGVVVLVLFGLLFVNLNWVQAYKADDYRNSDYNTHRVQISEYQRQRGSIEAAGGVVLAQSRQTDDDLKYQRMYPMGDQYAHIVGVKPVSNASTDIEKLENAYLQGNADSQVADRWLAMLTGKRTSGGNVLLTLSPGAQRTGYEALQNKGKVRKGAVVALDPSTGALLAAVSAPSFDPNPLVSHNSKAATSAFNQLEQNPDKPLFNRAFSELYPPGSTFKVIDSAAALANGVQPETVLQGGTSYTAPGTTHVIQNAPGVFCPEQITLKQALTVSCNTAFSRLAAEQLGADPIKKMAQAFGFEEPVRFDQDPKNVMGVATSHTGTMQDPNGQVDRPTVAQSAIGQSNVQMTPLQGALIAATVANGGRQMRPYLIDKELAADRTPTYVASPHEQRRPLNEQNAGTLRDMMINVVASNDGTGTSARIPGVQVGGKTGTAQNGNNPDHGWFIGFAIKDGKPVAAVAVFLEQAGSGGSHDAAQIAGNVMRAIIQERG